MRIISRRKLREFCEGHADSLAEDLEHRVQRTPEEDLFLELLLTLIEKFEEQHDPIPQSSGNAMVQHLLESRELNEADLIPILGTPTAVQEILSRQRSIQQNEASKLANFFHVDVSLFF
ncbi:MAG: hypothetical protein MUF49_32805 [Oculatellaceae cyanobacterium Prado106]|jgi:HTH-type transcriptional regulator/antitoxin HigA|nr:hypothetical protein [Oculatellaceae cyanobacterium Prado106]